MAKHRVNVTLMMGKSQVRNVCKKIGQASNKLRKLSIQTKHYSSSLKGLQTEQKNLEKQLNNLHMKFKRYEYSMYRKAS
jgi:phage-related tail protein